MGAIHSSQHTVPDAEHNSTRCFPTHEMWELPTLLIVANRSQQGYEVFGSYPLVLKTGISVHTYQYNRQTKSDAYANRLQKGDVFAHLSSFTQASKRDAKRRVLERGVQRYHSYFSRSHLPSAIGEDKTALEVLTRSARSDSPRKTRPEQNSGEVGRYLSGTCAWLQPVFQEPGASRLIAVVTSIRSTTRFETPSSDCTRSPDEISTIGFSSACSEHHNVPYQ
ncbi:F-box/kelch-repeat protein-like [Dorcoceras hygrometricum]|uniref:F-box/kelch-repeat protein-like n=1 Tax=Dorcoceras hygrometricum TaxID=472368 RepID=A0A2Z7BH66_9LAMI|nr:F-box/kelch-repeat protein-like [Dorcoceras hygrometricum]